MVDSFNYHPHSKIAGMQFFQLCMFVYRGAEDPVSVHREIRLQPLPLVHSALFHPTTAPCIMGYGRGSVLLAFDRKAFLLFKIFNLILLEHIIHIVVYFYELKRNVVNSANSENLRNHRTEVNLKITLCYLTSWHCGSILVSLHKKKQVQILFFKKTYSRNSVASLDSIKFKSLLVFLRCAVIWLEASSYVRNSAVVAT